MGVLQIMLLVALGLVVLAFLASLRTKMTPEGVQVPTGLVLVRTLLLLTFLTLLAAFGWSFIAEYTVTIMRRG